MLVVAFNYPTYDLEKDIGTDELKKDVFNEMRMEELKGFEKHKDD